ncbi:ciliary neurotrophic factor receptor subunit alpha [Erpetoichthys calabaricus]|uniref:Ciliary neurotrophic factor receptor n=1 Tax=Erpetoichthys calabaricus TaxID=27687 RepID=A0A8C4S6G7_ERPCA|nr:ciliary neurotrophic factor receptor subunit alpha [Erpetoichthys calabaricus]
MANIVTSACCVVLAAVVVVYAQRRSQQGARIQYEKIGSDVTMQCGTLGSEASVTWKVNGTDVENRREDDGPRLALKQVDLSVNGLYSCFQNPTGELKDQIILRVGNPPKEPIVTCRSNTYPKGFYCSWHLPHPTYIPTEFEVSVRHGLQDLQVQKDPIHKNRCHVKLPEIFSNNKYRVNVTATNALGNASGFLAFDEISIVKPDPPEKVVANPIPGNPRKLEVTWNSPSTWPDVETFPLKYFLRYRPLILDTWQHMELSDSTSYTITDAYAGKEYIIQVAAKDTEIGTWSDWSVAIHATPWIEEPKQIIITTTTEADENETTPSQASPSAKPQVGDTLGSSSAALTLSANLFITCIIVLII